MEKNQLFVFPQGADNLGTTSSSEFFWAVFCLEFWGEKKGVRLLNPSS